jgi:hypothetical protein
VLDGDPDKLSQLSPNHVYLDDLSGDYYSFDKFSSQWKPLGNFGLHYSRAEASIQGVIVGSSADLMKKVKTYENTK